MNIEPAVILALISNLAEQAFRLQTENEELRARLEASAQHGAEPGPVSTG